MPEARFRVRRCDPAQDGAGEGRYDEFVVLYETSLTVLQGLFAIQERQDASLAFRYCCRAAVCGSCAMYINGRYRLACQTNIRHLRQGPITVDPLPHLPIVRDLVCDMSAFFAKYEYIRPWLMRTSRETEHEIPQSPGERRRLDMPIDCILCGACYSSCPSVWAEENYLGPAALLRAQRFEVDSRDQGGAERTPTWENERGIYRCHTIMNCVEACPKRLNPTEGIQWLKRAAVRRRLFGRKK
jgi:succinate dehydrogenase / fumarate reductase iron-sulfur subunit